MLMMKPPLLRYFWFHSINSLAVPHAVCSLQCANVIHRLLLAFYIFVPIIRKEHFDLYFGYPQN